MLENGTRLGSFEILGPLGAGGMGEVYRARDTKLGREVAIKVLPPELAGDAERLARFEQEARSASALNHPNIVTIYDIGEEGSTLYLVMELVEGRTLRDLVRKGPLPIKKALSVGEQAAEGLAKAHAAGIVHRDLKPENLMVTEDGIVKILDFGLAKLLPRGSDSGSQLPTVAGAATASGTVMGTAGYMSPEQASGTLVDFRSDQFSLASVLYELVTGERAFHRDSFVQTLTAIIEDDPEPITRRNPRVPVPLQWVVERCLAKDAAERYASTLDLAHDLRRVRENLSEMTTASVAVQPPRARRRPAGPFLGGTAFGLAIGVGLLLLGLPLTRTPTPEPARLSIITFSGHDKEPSASPDGRTLAFVSTRDDMPRIWLKQLDGGEEVPLTSGPDAHPRFSPDGSMVLFARDDGGATALYRVPRLGGEPRKVIDDATEGDWSPDGKRIAFIRWNLASGEVRSIIGTVTVDGQDETEVGTVERRPAFGLRYSPGGEWLAVSVGAFGAAESSGKRVHLMRTDGSDQKEVYPPQEGGDLSAVAWLDSGDEILYSHGESVTTLALGAAVVNTGASRILRQNIHSGEAQILLWNPNISTAMDLVGPGHLVLDGVVARGNLVEFDLAQPTANRRTISRGASLDRQPVYSRDGRWLAFSSNRSGNLDIWARDRESEALRRLTDHPSDDWDPAFTADGRHLIWTSRRSGNFEIWMAEADGSGAHQVTRDGVNAENATMTADRSWLVYNSANPRGTGIWKIRPDGSDATQLVAATTQWPEVSPDGQYVAFTTVRRSGQIRIGVVRIEDGALVPFEVQLQGTDAFIGRNRWMPDGRRIAFAARSADRRPGIFAQDFVPGADTSGSRRPLVDFSPNVVPESFGIAPDGSRITIAVSESSWSLMSAENLPGLGSSRAGVN